MHVLATMLLTKSNMKRKCIYLFILKQNSLYFEGGNATSKLCADQATKSEKSVSIKETDESW